MAIVLARVRLMNVFGQVSKWIATSEAQKLLHVKMGIEARKIQVIPHFVTKPEPPPPYNKEGYILFLGSRLSQGEGRSYFIRSVEAARRKIAAPADRRNRP